MKKNLNIPNPKELLEMAENQSNSWKEDDFAKSAAEGVRLMEKPENMLDISDRLNHQIMGSIQAPVSNKLTFNSLQIMALAASVCLLAVFTFMFMQSNNMGDALSEQSAPTMIDDADLALEKDVSGNGLSTKGNELEKFDTKMADSELRGRRETVLKNKIDTEKVMATERKESNDLVAKKELEKTVSKSEEAKPVFIGDSDGYGATDKEVAKLEEEELDDIVALEIKEDVMLESAGSARTADKTLLKTKSKKDEGVKLKSSKLVASPYRSAELDIKQNNTLNNSIGYFQQANYSKASDELTKLVDENPTSLELNYQQGINYLYQNKISKAKKYFEKASETKTDTAVPQIDFVKLNELLKAKKTDEAKAYINQFELKDGKILKK